MWANKRVVLSSLSGALVLIALGLLTKFFYYIPQAALAGLIIIAVLDMVDFSVVRRLWKVKRKILNLSL